MWNELRFYYYHGYKLDLKNPRTFLEKLQWQKYFGKIERPVSFAPRIITLLVIKPDLVSKRFTVILNKGNMNMDNNPIRITIVLDIILPILLRKKTARMASVEKRATFQSILISSQNVNFLVYAPS
jgi:hypothetical protein